MRCIECIYQNSNGLSAECEAVRSRIISLCMDGLYDLIMIYKIACLTGVSISVRTEIDERAA